MATKYWQPKVTAVAQLTTVTVGGTLSGETFTLTVNGIDIATHTDADTVIATTVAALVAAWNASTHAYATGITAADASPTLTLTADNAGEPFVITLNTPGGSATLGQAETTSATGPNHVDAADNWGGSLPSNSDIIVFRDSSISAPWGLDQLSTTGHTLEVEQTYTGLLGLASATFLLADTANTTAQEYRPDYFTLDISRLEIGGHTGPGIPSGSQRIKVDNDRASANTTVIHDTASAAAETSKPPVRLKFVHADADIDVRSGSGGVGIAMDIPGETSTIGDIVVQGGKFYAGSGVTLTNLTVSGGDAIIDAAATITAIKVHGGNVRTEGDYTVTTLTTTGGNVTANHIKTAGSAITTANLEGGTTDASKGGEARTWATVNLSRGATLIGDDDILTITTLNEPDGPYTISVS